MLLRLFILVRIHAIFLYKVSIRKPWARILFAKIFVLKSIVQVWDWSLPTSRMTQFLTSVVWVFFYEDSSLVRLSINQRGWCSSIWIWNIRSTFSIIKSWRGPMAGFWGRVIWLHKRFFHSLRIFFIIMHLLEMFSLEHLLVAIGSDFILKSRLVALYVKVDVKFRFKIFC